MSPAKSFSLPYHSSSQSPHNYEVVALLKEDAENYQFNFSVKKKSMTNWNTNPSFSTYKNDNYGLWEYDVVEVFIQSRSHSGSDSTPYMEIQVSPLGQAFQLKIVEPRKKTLYPPSLNWAFSPTFSQDKNIWSVDINVAKSNFTEEIIYGNLCACLGPKESRNFFALAAGAEPAPDFHRPGDFIPFFP